MSSAVCCDTRAPSMLPRARAFSMIHFRLTLIDSFRACFQGPSKMSCCCIASDRGFLGFSYAMQEYTGKRSIVPYPRIESGVDVCKERINGIWIECVQSIKKLSSSLLCVPEFRLHGLCLNNLGNLGMLIRDFSSSASILRPLVWIGAWIRGLEASSTCLDHFLSLGCVLLASSRVATSPGTARVQYT